MSNGQRIDANTLSKREFTYDSKGRILTKTDANGNKETYIYHHNVSGASSYTTAIGETFRYDYDDIGRLSEVKSMDGRRIYGYNNFGQRTHIIDEEGNTSRYEYDFMANLIREIRPQQYDRRSDGGIGTTYEYDVWENLSHIIKPDGGIYSYQNDFHGKILQAKGPNDTKESHGIRLEYDADHRLIRTIYPDGGILREFYDAEGNLLKRVLPEQYDAEQDDGLGYAYEYDCRNRLVQVTNPYGKIVHRYIYDLAGNIIKDIGTKGYDTADNDEERIGTLYTYDLRGKVTSIRRPLDVVEGIYQYSLVTYQYDFAGNCVEEKRYLDNQTRESQQGRVNVIRYSYDEAGRLIRTEDTQGACLLYTYDGRNRRTSEKKKLSEDIWQERHYFYSPAGNLIKIMDSCDEEGCGRKYAPTLLEHDKNGNITKIVLPSEDEILREYDICDRLIAEEHRAKNGDIHNRTEYIYDKTGNLLRSVRDDGYTIEYTYDELNRPVLKTDTLGAREESHYNKNGRLTAKVFGEAEKYSYMYDLSGRNICISKADGSILRKTTYNPYGEVEEQMDAMGGVSFRYDFAGRRRLVSTQGNSSQEYAYDAAGNIIALKDGNGNATSYDTDLWGRITRIHNAGGTEEAYTYDHAGNVLTATDGNGNAVKYAYNRMNLMSARTDAKGETENFVYDLSGRLKEHTDREGRKSSYRYNMYGALASRRDDKTGLTESWEYNHLGWIKSAVGGGMRYDYTYYDNGLLKEKRASGRTLLAYTYDTSGRRLTLNDITGKKTRYEYDSYGSLAAVYDEDRLLATYAYYPDGTLKSRRIGRDILTDFVYDSDKNLTMSKTIMGGDILLEGSYKYDANGNRTEKWENQELTKYGYDACNRLIQVQYPDPLGERLEDISYDHAGNRISHIISTVSGSMRESYTYDNANRLLQINRSEYKTGMQEAVSTETENFTYDKNGNLLTDGKGTRYLYDAFGRTSEVWMQDGNVQKNHYDAEGLRAEMEENGRLVQFLFSDREVVAETQDDGNVVRYIRGLGIISSDSESAKTYYHYVSDESESVRYIVDEENEIKNDYEYDAFGNTLACKETVHNRFRYNGEQYDSLTNQYYLRARYYNPVIARFTQEDTYYGDGLNLYAYCANNPVTYKDPSGNGKVEQNPYNRYNNQGSGTQDITGDQRALRDIVNEVNAKGGASFEEQIIINEWANQLGEKGLIVEPQKLLPGPTSDGESAGLGDLPERNLVLYANQVDDDSCMGTRGSESGTNSIDTPINSGVSKPREVATPNSIYEQMNPDGTVKSRAFYDENGNQFSRQDFDHRHFDKKTKQYYQPHEHNYSYNENGQPTGKSDGPLPKGYSNKPTN